MSRWHLILLGAVHFVLIAASQVFIFNNIHFFGYINPMIYVWFVLMLPYSTPKWAVLLLSFAMGLCIDVMSLGQGFHIVSLTLIGFIRPFLLKFYTANRETTFWQRPSLADMGFAQYTFYVTILVFIHHTLYFGLDIFRFNEIIPFILRLTASFVTTIVVILISDMLFIKRRI
ncbi:MAG: hypothetical protein LBR17_04870 [Bacteroidales bacterium]|jgi:rod shape-determining protein MreD|nr:hypothetical protein [Bacteroidales bacterium]